MKVWPIQYDWHIKLCNILNNMWTVWSNILSVTAILSGNRLKRVSSTIIHID